MTAAVTEYRLPCSLPDAIVAMVNDDLTGFSALEVEEFFSREVLGLDEVAAIWGDNGQVTGVELRQLNTIDPVLGIMKRFDEALQRLASFLFWHTPVPSMF